jgi:hypothetical protein
MKIHAIQTRTVAVKTCQPRGVGHGKRRLLNTALDREWTEPLLGEDGAGMNAGLGGRGQLAR